MSSAPMNRTTTFQPDEGRRWQWPRLLASGSFAMIRFLGPIRRASRWPKRVVDLWAARCG